MKTLSYPSTPVLPALADDVVEAICQQAGPRTAAKLTCVSRDFKRMTASPNLWRGFYQQHLTLAPPPHSAASRGAFAQEVPAALERQAAKACLGDLERDNVFLVTFPNEQNTTSCAIDVLANTAAAMERPFRRIDATRLHEEQDLANLGPGDFCVFEHVDSVGPASMRPLHAFVDAAARESGHKVVLLHADTLDTCDGGLVRRVREPITYDVTPANFSVDPDPIHTRFSAP